MSDNISRKAVLGIIGNMPTEEIARALAYVSVSQLPSVDEWIPCSERLPEIDRDEWTGVFATVMSEHDKEIRWVRELVYDENGTWCYPTGETYDQIVVAWIPKPEPYKGGK